MARRGVRSASRKPAKAPATAGDVLAALDAIAPFAHAEDWDNVGLLLGDAQWPARSVLLALDLTNAVAEEALRKQADLIVCYHPPIFRGTKSLTSRAEGPTDRLAELLAARISVIALHTAFDVAPGGINDLLLDAFDVAERWPLQTALVENAEYKLIVFVPEPEVRALRAALASAGAGVIGEYTQCSYELRGRGSFRGGDASNPTVGQRGRLEYVDEVRLEMVAPRERIGAIVRTLYAAHSYEEPAFDLVPLDRARGRGDVGLGRVGLLRQRTRGDALIAQLDACVDLSIGTVVGALRRRFTHVVAAAGSFGERSFRDPNWLYITGEFKHHEALQLLRRGITAVCMGHYASERLALDNLRERLSMDIRGARVRVATNDRSPFQPLTA